MSQKADQPSGNARVQVFELTMDNPEDQDELNRRLRKPGESGPGARETNGHTDQGGSTGKQGTEQKGTA